MLGLAVPIAPIESSAEALTTFKTALPVRPVPLPARARPGVPELANAPAVIAAIEQATAAVACGEAAALVTNPIAKHVVAARRFPLSGPHRVPRRARRAALAGRRYHPVMMLAAQGFRVVPLTVHCRLCRRAQGDHARAHLPDRAHHA